MRGDVQLRDLAFLVTVQLPAYLCAHMPQKKQASLCQRKLPVVQAILAYSKVRLPESGGLLQADTVPAASLEPRQQRHTRERPLHTLSASA